jgi:hypothetical protein
MAYGFSDGRIGAQPIANTSTVQQHPLGTELSANDPTLGEGRFIYLLGVASTVIGSLVKYNATTWQTVLAANTANQDVPVAVAMSANVASQYGWYQIGGNAVIKKTAVTVSPQVSLFLSATAGRVKVLASAGLQLLGARSANLATVTSTTSTVTVTISRPFLQGQVT